MCVAPLLLTAACLTRAQGHVVLQRQEQLIQKALSGAQRYQLGGAEGLTRGWGSCMGCRVQGEIIKYRSTLGNRLAQKSAELGLSPVGLIAYVEVSRATVKAA